MTTRKRNPKTPEQKALKDFHDASDKHVLCLEADLTREETYRFFHHAELLRKFGNDITGKMKKRYVQMTKTKAWRKLREEYSGACTKKDEDEKKKIGERMNAMQEEYGVTKAELHKIYLSVYRRYNLDSVTALARMEDVWKGFEKCLFKNGKKVHFRKKGDLPVIRAKQRNRTIVLKNENNKLTVSSKGLVFSLKVKENDIFAKQEIEAILYYLCHARDIDKAAADLYKKTKQKTDTFRPCYASLVCEIIRGKPRVFVHITIEGRALPKKDRFGNPRHEYGIGNVGSDIGTQTVAWTSKEETGLKNLAERSRKTLPVKEREERILLRKMERSRRVSNPDNYNEDGTIRKGKKTWVYSKRYRKLRRKHQETARKNALSRKYAVQEEVNHFRSLGNIFVTEPKNASSLAKRAKTGKRKKRFGHSIQNRCPGYFQELAKNKFESTGGKYIEVDSSYRASQYDHTADDFIKKKLSQRMYNLQDGTKVQRDWYSSFLLYCADPSTHLLSRQKAKDEFNDLWIMHNVMIQHIKDEKIDIKNSGIKIR